MLAILSRARPRRYAPRVNTDPFTFPAEGDTNLAIAIEKIPGP
jgi:hypothetical protein